MAAWVFALVSLVAMVVTAVHAVRAHQAAERAAESAQVANTVLAGMSGSVEQNLAACDEARAASELAARQIAQALSIFEGDQ